jgi:flagellar biosynthesis activator protein FlaF
MPGLGLNAYRQTVAVTSSGRDLEAHVLTKAAHSLKECQIHWGDEDHRERLDVALRTIQKIWTIFQSDLASDENPLPQEVKNNLITLSLFIDKRVFEIMASPTPEKLDSIININLNIAEGLRGSSYVSEEPVMQQASDASPTATRSNSQPQMTLYSRAYAK